MYFSVWMMRNNKMFYYKWANYGEPVEDTYKNKLKNNNSTNHLI